MYRGEGGGERQKNGGGQGIKEVRTNSILKRALDFTHTVMLQLRNPSIWSANAHIADSHQSILGQILWTSKSQILKISKSGFLLYILILSTKYRFTDWRFLPSFMKSIKFITFKTLRIYEARKITYWKSLFKVKSFLLGTKDQDLYWHQLKTFSSPMAH